MHLPTSDRNGELFSEFSTSLYRTKGKLGLTGLQNVTSLVKHFLHLLRWQQRSTYKRAETTNCCGRRQNCWRNSLLFVAVIRKCNWEKNESTLSIIAYVSGLKTWFHWMEAVQVSSFNCHVSSFKHQRFDKHTTPNYTFPSIDTQGVHPGHTFRPPEGESESFG